MKKFSFKTLVHALTFVLFLCFIKFMRFLGLERARTCGSFLARKLGRFSHLNKVVNFNLKYIYPEISELKIKELEKQVWDNLGRYISEFAFLDKEFLTAHPDLVEIEGRENIEELLKVNQPFIIFAGHFANWDFVLFALLQIIKQASVFYRKVNNKFIDNFIKAKRALGGANLIPKGHDGVKDLIRSLKNKQNMVMLVDQKMDEGIKVPFMGKPAMTVDAVAMFSREYDYLLLPTRIFRKEDGNYKLIFYPSFKANRTDNKDADIYQTIERINDILGQWVYENPGQWFWVHQRWGKIKELLQKES